MLSECDVAVIGAGFGGLYAVHKVRDQLGLSVQGFDLAGGPGGTWWWNRYPGARCDIPSVHYAYTFSDDVQREWEWTERFASQPEILSYLEFVADKFDVRKEFAFSTQVTAIRWQDDRWVLTTATGETCIARFVIAATGNLSLPKERSEFPGIEEFAGEVLATSRWPRDAVDFTGKRVGVIGTGSTGIQVIQELAGQVEHLTVFQRTPNYAVPLRNDVVEPARRRWLADNFEDVRAHSRERFLGAPYDPWEPSALAAAPDDRKARYDRLWDEGGFAMLASSYADLLLDESANATAADYIRERIHQRVRDPQVAELLSPHDHPYGTKRPPLETGYYEVFNQDNVELVDVRSVPIERLTLTGIRTAERDHDLDVLVLATGFDAITGPLLNLGIVGRDGLSLAEHWAEGPRTYLGIAVSGFPNLFTITGPQSAVALYNNPLAIEDHVDLAAAAISYVIDVGSTTIETEQAAENAWYAQVDGLLNLTLLPKADSWYTGGNVPGKPRATFVFAGGAPLYRAMCADAVGRDFAGFSVDGAPAPPVPPMVQLDAAVAAVVGETLGQKPLSESTLEETRAMIESFAFMQKPAPTGVRVIDTSYPGPSDERPARVFVPTADGLLPVIVYFHGGGFVAGSIDSCAAVCANLAEELGAVVVTPSYRLAPEHPFPAATDDTFAALAWAASSVAEFGGDPEQLVVMGDSAGGQLAAVAAQRARDEGGPRLMAQVLVYPIIDVDSATPSRLEFADGPLLTPAAAAGMWAGYLGDLSAAASPLASPARAGSLSGLAPALVLTAGCDPVRDEGEDYGAALAAAGVPTEVRRLPGLVHGTYYMSGLVPRAAEFNGAVSEFLAPLIHRQASTLLV